MNRRGKGRGRGRGRGRGLGRVVADSTPSAPPTSTPIRPPELGQQYNFTPATDASAPRRPLTQTQLDVGHFPPPPKLFADTSTPRDQRASSESQQSNPQPLQSNPQPQQTRPQPQKRRSSTDIGDLSPGETCLHPQRQKTLRPTSSFTFSAPTRQNSEASEAQHSNEVEGEHVNGVDDSVHHESSLPEDQLNYMHQLLTVPNRHKWTCNLSPDKPQPKDTTW